MDIEYLYSAITEFKNSENELAIAIMFHVTHIFSTWFYIFKAHDPDLKIMHAQISKFCTIT